MPQHLRNSSMLRISGQPYESIQRGPQRTLAGNRQLMQIHSWRVTTRMLTLLLRMYEKDGGARKLRSVQQLFLSYDYCSGSRTLRGMRLHVRAQQQVRAQEQLRDAAARSDPEVRVQQQLRNTAQHAAARADPEVRAQQQLRDTARHAAARLDPEVRALQQQPNTAQHAAVRQIQQHDRQAAPRDTLLARMHRLLHFMDLHRDAAIDLPDFLLAIPEGRVQDLPGGQLSPDRQVPYTVQLQCASTMAVALRRRMPSRVCAVCSKVCSEEESTVLSWMEIPNVDILRADVMCTDAVQRWGHTVVWQRMARTAQGEAPPPPDPVLPARYRVSRAERAAAVDDDGGSASGAGRLVDDAAEGALEMGGDAPETDDLDAVAAEQQPPEQLPPDQQPRAPRVLPRACLDDPASVEVPYCMRLEPDLPNRTMLVSDGVAERIFICTTCHKALSARRVPEAALARLDPGDVPRVNHLGDPLPLPTFLEGQLLGRGRIIQQLLIMYLADRPPDVFPRAVKTHGIGVVNPDPNMLRGQLPARASDLAGSITVVCVDQVHSRAELLERMRKAPGLQVRGQVIVAWVRFLQHNDEEELAIDEDALQEYERMGCAAGVPDEILHAALAPTDPEVANVLCTTFLHDRTGAAGVRQFQDVVEAAVRDGDLADAAAAPDVDPAGPVQPTLADPTPNAGHDAGPGPLTAILRGPVDQPVEGAPVDPAAATLDELELILPQPSNVGDDGSEIDRFPGRVEDLLTGRARLAFAAGGRDSHVLDDRHPAILTLCFPQSFPYGFSGQRPRGMSFPAYCRHLLHRVPRTQFGGNLMLLARMYDICVRHESMVQVGITMNMRPHLGEPAACVPCDVIRAMGTILALPYRHSQRRQLLAQQSPLVKVLVEGARLSTLRLDLTDAYYNGARSKMHAAALTIGWPPLFFTVNPADMHAACAVMASGQVLDFDDDGRPQHIPSTVEKWRRVKDDPYSCAALLVATKEVLVEELFGFTPGAMQQTNPRCFCGLTFEVAVKVEQSGRLALHIHGVAHVADMWPVDAFTALSAGAEQSPEAATTAAVLVEAEEQEGYTVTNAVQSYVLRGEELSGLDCSMYNIASNYELGGSLPRRPRPGTSAAGMAQYYAFVLGTFKAHRGQPIPPGLTVKEAYDTWWAELGTTETGRSYQAYVSVLLDNIEEDHAGKARRQAEYNQRRRQHCAAAAAATLPEGDSMSASDGDADDGIRGHLRPDPETQPPAEDQLEHFVYIPGQEYPTAGTDLAAVALTDLFDCTNAAGAYAYDAARRCRAPTLVDGHGARSDRFSRRITPADLPLLTEATKRLKQYLVAAAAGTVEADGGAHTGLTATPEMDTPHVELHRPTSGPLVAIVRMPGTPERTEQARMPIYVHLLQPPSIDDTIELFTLAPHQAVPFMLMARYFDRRDEPNPGDPPQMLVEGKPVHRSLSTHAMFALSAGSNRADSVRKGSTASLQVHHNVGDGALIIDEIGMNSLDHLGACNHSCTRHLLPPPHLAGDHPAATIFSGRPSANTGDEFQHPKPGGPPLYRYTAAVECNPQFSPSVPTAQPLHGDEDNDGDPNEAAAGSQGGQQQPEVAARRPRAVPQTQSCILEGFRVYRSLAKTVFLLEKQQRQDSSPSGRRLTEYASMFGGEPATEQRIAEMVDNLNSRAIIDLADLAHLEPRVVLQRNEPRHTLNTRLIMLEAQRKNQRLVVWNADHVPVQKRGAAVEPALTHVEKAVAMQIKDHEFGHTTADTWYYHGARYILLDTTAADAGASHNNEVEACGLLEDGREPADDGRGPYHRLKYLPVAVIVRPINGHIPGTVLQGLGDYASRGGAFILSPRTSCIAEVEMPAAGCGTITKQIRRLNVPLGDRQAVTDYFVQGRSFKDECWLVDLAVPPNGIKRATLYVLLTRFKTLDHVRLLRPLYTMLHERKRIIRQFLSATNLEPDLAANLRLLKQAAHETEQRYTMEFEHARQLEARWARPGPGPSRAELS
ncbi:hypothetical protein VOLCADRAFT_95420 [Volvox carteri f. nagariensis]|uniref:DUF6570 domain-containing protein n=2 Tax=Volvox carteri f. nagariensis TaxID=3068 RepID=D8U7E4_VOLCA|nr:uncharacterized protein VOLCADRAFT_95420 [Volvox carteri f. nagariensis]EFJ44473.1 hypothetical protein VOLCADRAFT_95420 [Volvox carteri f. nagariensis]|eukprot:XP_002954580.1 hypothetical protein VOLCADRAFT_95420 [Volvox carteri f. nagariensis]